MTRDIKEWFACWLQSMARYAFSFQHEGLPEKFDDIPIVNVYEAPREKGGDWKQYFRKGEAWIITPLHNSSGTGSKKYIRKASGGGRWNGHGPQLLKKNLDTYCEKRKYTLEGTGVLIPTYTMFEYLPAQDKPTHALCRITVDNMNIASSQQQEGQEIDHHTDRNNRDKCKTSLSHKSMQQGGNFQNATWYSNESNLEMFLAQVVHGRELSEFGKHFPKDKIMQVFARKMDEKPDASPMEHRTEAAVRNPRKRSHRNKMKTITEADLCTPRKKQAKVEGKGHKHRRGQNFSDAEIHETFSRAGYEKKRALRKTSRERVHAMKTRNADYSNPINDQPNTSIYPTIQGSTSNHATTVPENIGSNNIFATNPAWTVEKMNNYVQEIIGQNAGLQDPNQLSPNFIAATEGRLGHQINFHANSAEGMENNNQLPNYNQNTIAPGPSTSNHATIELEISDWNTIGKEMSDYLDFN